MYKIEHLLLIQNTTKNLPAEQLSQLIGRLQNGGCQVSVLPENRDLCELLPGVVLTDADLLSDCQAALVLGGDGSIIAAMHIDSSGKIMRVRIHPNSSIGMHTHETNYEVCFVISGKGKAVFNGTEETLAPGVCHYCPKGESHTLINTGDEDLVFFAVVSGM